MFCRKCGNEIPNDSAFCFKCGAPITEEKKVGDSKLWEYTNAVRKMDTARTAEELENLEKTFERLGDYKDSAEKLKQCREKNISVLYSRTIKIIDTAQDITDIQTAVKNLKYLGDYKNSKELLEKCEFDLKLFEYNDAYKKLEGAETPEECIEARDTLAAFGDFEDCPQLVAECEEKYIRLIREEAESLRKSGSPEELGEFLTTLKPLVDSEEMTKTVEEIKGWFSDKIYNCAIEKVKALRHSTSAEEYFEAAKLFRAVPEKKNSVEYAELCEYNAKAIKFNLVINKLEVAKDEYQIEDCRLDFLEIKDFEEAERMAKECERQAKSISRLDELKKLVTALLCSNDIDTLKETARKARDIKHIGNAAAIADECQRKVECIQRGEQFTSKVWVASAAKADLSVSKLELKKIDVYDKPNRLSKSPSPNVKPDGKSSNNEVFCRKCGNRSIADSDTRFCRFCGAEIK